MVGSLHEPVRSLVCGAIVSGKKFRDARRKQPVISDALLERLLDGTDVKSASGPSKTSAPSSG